MRSGETRMEFFVGEIIPIKNAINNGEMFPKEQLEDLAKRAVILLRSQQSRPTGAWVIREGEDPRGIKFSATSENDVSLILRSWPYGNQTELESPTEAIPLQKLVIRWNSSTPEIDPSVEVFNINYSGEQVLDLSGIKGQATYVSLLEMLFSMSN